MKTHKTEGDGEQIWRNWGERGRQKVQGAGREDGVLRKEGY